VRRKFDSIAKPCSAILLDSGVNSNVSDISPTETQDFVLTCALYKVCGDAGQGKFDRFRITI